jgi:hydroxymethylpyrimidine/phosphomethylpyrimidine kinase
MPKKISFVLSIAGSDSGAGAGIQSDLKTFHNHGVYGVTVVTAVTAQNTLGVQSSHELPAEIIDAQLKSVFDDFDISAVKTGMLSSGKVIEIIYEHLRKKAKIKLIIDPAILSKNGFPLLNEKGIALMKSKLLPLTYLITPNIYETEILSGIHITSVKELEEAAKELYDHGCRNVLIKGGHLPAEIGIDKGTDILYNGEKFVLFNTKFVKSKNTHGIGCVFSSAIASNLVLGYSLKRSIILAKGYIVKSLERTRNVGKGYGPVEQV